MDKLILASAGASCLGTSASSSSGEGGSGWWMLIIYAALFAALYFFLIRPSSKKKKAEQEMKNSVQIGDQIITIGGIVGTVVAIKEEDETFVIETGADRLKMKFKKWAISSVVKDEDEQPKKKSFKEMREERQKAKEAKKAEKAKETEEKK